jgi:transcriptional regulator with XRE-family HTH domain
MVKLSELKTAEAVRANDMQDPEYRREYERTRLANDVATKVIQYRAEHGLSQTELAKRLGMRQPNVARLESGDHEPTIATLSLLAQVLKQDFSVDVKPSQMRLRRPALSAGKLASSRRGGLIGRSAFAPAASASSGISSRTISGQSERSGQRPAGSALLATSRVHTRPSTAASNR